MPGKKFSLTANRPSLFEPSVIRGITTTQGNSVVLSKENPNPVVSSATTGSFKYDQTGRGVRNTQQLRIDWSKFENHTFFNSAQVKTNVAVQKVIDNFPFDGTQVEVESFFSDLTGFERWVFDQFPKSKTYLFLSGTTGPETSGGTYVSAKDFSGAKFPQLSSKTDGESILMPRHKSMTAEFWIYLPEQSNGNQIIFDKTNGVSLGYAAVLDATGSSTEASISFHVVSGGLENKASVEAPKGFWNHVAFVWDRTPGAQTIQAFLNQDRKQESPFAIEFGELPPLPGDFTIGSGSAFATFLPEHTLSGALDEMRIWHEIRSQEDLRKFAKRNVFSSPNLRLYYRFNEPPMTQTRLVLDQSSKALHGELSLTGYNLGVRDLIEPVGPSPISLEKDSLNPVLFPRFPALRALHSSLLVSASLFDADNPNLITRLIPPHYFLEAQSQDGFDTVDTDIIKPLISGSDPKTTQLESTTAMLSLLYLVAKQLDETKLFIQDFSNTTGTDYSEFDNVADAFLLDLAKKEGVSLPPLFAGSTIEQFLDADDIQEDHSTNLLSLQQVQNQIWRRILVNLNDIMKSKGTIYSIKAFLRNVGIEPDNNFRIREYGGPSRKPLTFSRETRSEAASMVDLSLGGLLRGSFLSASRIEPGFPEISLDLNAGNHLLTSGSFTFEGTYKFSAKSSPDLTQSLVRLHAIDGVNAVAPDGAPLLNLLTTPSGGLVLRGEGLSSSDSLTVSLDAPSIFDGNQWYVSFGRRRNDDGLNSNVSSSYFVRAVRQGFGEILETYETSSWFDDRGSPLYQDNPDGTFLMIGSQSLNPEWLGDTSDAFDASTDFTGKVSYLRFWSKHLSQEEFLEHVRNPGSVGVVTPSSNFNFVTNVSGSWGRLRSDCTTDQIITSSSGIGEIDLVDFSQNDLGFSGEGFASESPVIVPELFYYSFISPKYDESVTSDKIRVRSYLDFTKTLSSSYAEQGPLYALRESERPTDSLKFGIDFSISDALDQDIIKIFATLDELDNALGSPELLYASDYPSLVSLRETYFNRLTGKVNLRNFFDFYKWFDTNLGSFIEQLVPHRTRYKGVNFVVESHMLDRSKFQYRNEEAHFSDVDRSLFRDTILLRLIVGSMGRY